MNTIVRPATEIMNSDNLAPQPYDVRAAAVGDIPHLAEHRALMFRDMGVLAEDLTAALAQASGAYLHEAMPPRHPSCL